MKKLIAVGLSAAALASGAVACSSPADTASKNLSKDADNFRIPRKITFINGITDKYLLTIEGYCSLGNADNPRELTVTCKTGPGEFKKDFLGLSDNVTYVVDQLRPQKEDPYHYKVFFRPSTIIPNFESGSSAGN